MGRTFPDLGKTSNPQLMTLRTATKLYGWRIACPALTRQARRLPYKV
jgi:hypothetical protein